MSVPTAALVAIAAVAGLCLGSFANVVIHRVPAGRSVVHPPSACPACGARVRPADNLPVVSWLVLRGRCRDCRHPIGVRYPLVELAGGVLAALAAWRFAAEPAVVAAYVVGFVALLCLGVVDLDLLRVPDRILGPSLALVAVAMAAAAPWTGWDHLLRALAGGAAAFAVFCAVHLAVPHGLGFGDVKLSFLLGGLLGWIGLAHVFVGLFAGVLLGAGVGVVLRWSRRLGPRQHVPFVPFLAAGTVLGVLLGRPIVAWWLGA